MVAQTVVCALGFIGMVSTFNAATSGALLLKKLRWRKPENLAG